MISGLFNGTKGAKAYKAEAMKETPEEIANKLYYLGAINNMICDAEIPPLASEMVETKVWDVIRDEDVSFNDIVHTMVDVSNTLLQIRDLLVKAFNNESPEVSNE